jgi:hypothetical protein
MDAASLQQLCFALALLLLLFLVMQPKLRAAVHGDEAQSSPAPLDGAERTAR